VATTDGLDRFRAYCVPTISLKQGLLNSEAYSVLAAQMANIWIGLGLPYTHGRTDKYLCSAAAWVLGRRTENSEESHPTLFFRTAADESGSHESGVRIRTG